MKVVKTDNESINKLINRRGMVKVSSKPGKTQSLNFFLVEDSLYLVDLPGYGFAKVPKKPALLALDYPRF